MYEISWFFLWKFTLISTFTLKLNFLGVLTIFSHIFEPMKVPLNLNRRIANVGPTFFFTQNCLPLFSNWLIWMWISNPMRLICRIFPPKGDIAFPYVARDNFTSYSPRTADSHHKHFYCLSRISSFSQETILSPFYYVFSGGIIKTVIL